ncbi:hypothetical protein B1P93_09330 [Enterococcus faecium]|nr:hypothetical protein B1P93_09330 [Enterococcus faecium]
MSFCLRESDSRRLVVKGSRNTSSKLTQYLIIFVKKSVAIPHISLNSYCQIKINDIIPVVLVNFFLEENV